MYGRGNNLNFGYFGVALVATAALSFGAATQFLFIGMRRRGEIASLAFGFLCVCLGVLALSSAVQGATDSVTTAILAYRVLCGAAVLAFPALVLFVGSYTGQLIWRPAFALVCLVSLGFFVFNLLSPFSMLNTHLEAGTPLVLAWGESLFMMNGRPSAASVLFRWFGYVVFLWALWRAGRQFFQESRWRGGMLGLCLLFQFCAFLWGVILVDRMGRPYPPLDALAFLSFVLMMGLSLARRLHSHSLRLEQSTVELRAEVATRHQIENDLRHAAYHDALTGLPNRLRALHALDERLTEARQSNGHGALLMLDLDNFKTINDSLGHHAGDRVLESIADSLLASAPSGSTVARFGGDEFMVLLDGLAHSAEAAAEIAMTAAQRILQGLALPLTLDTRTLGVGASIGIALFPAGNTVASDIIQRADIALYRAKASGRNAVQLFLPQMQREADERLELERGLRGAIERQEFSLVYQPQVDTRGRLTGAEALLRWTHPELGQVSPATFIPLAEETGLILAIGHWVMGEVCKRIRVWQSIGVDFGGRISVNVSAWQIAQPRFVEQMREQIASFGLQPSCITLELTETALLKDFELALQTLQHLSASGFRISLDDFGTGYSSLSYLQQLPLDELKIDQSFISTLGCSVEDPLAAFVIDVGRRLGMTTIAEGVETVEQKVLLETLGCDVLQGFLICRPVPADEFEGWTHDRENHACLTTHPHIEPGGRNIADDDTVLA